MILLYAADAFSQTQKTNLIGFVKSKEERGFGCYLTSPSEYNKKASDRRYYFLDDDLGGTMNIEGRDVFLEQSKSDEIPPMKGKKRFVWVFHTQQTIARFDLTATKTANDGAALYYDALITITKGNKKQSVKAKGFCGG